MFQFLNASKGNYELLLVRKINLHVMNTHKMRQEIMIK